MRPWSIMVFAIVYALLVCMLISELMFLAPHAKLPAKESASNKLPAKESASKVFGAPMRTTVEQAGGGKLNPAAAAPVWAFGCVAVLTAPKSMKVDDTAIVKTILLVATGSDSMASLLRAANETETAINAASSPSSIDNGTGLDETSADALRRMIDGNRNRQAAVDTLPGSPIMTVHLAGPDFGISPVTPERQAFPGKQPGNWEWVVKALASGPRKRTLTVSYSAEVLVEGQRVPEALRTISREVVVDVSPTALLTEVDATAKSAKSIAENVSWFWTTLIFPALMFLYGLRKWFKQRHMASRLPG